MHQANVCLFLECFLNYFSINEEVLRSSQLKNNFSKSDQMSQEKFWEERFLGWVENQLLLIQHTV